MYFLCCPYIVQSTRMCVTIRHTGRSDLLKLPYVLPTCEEVFLVHNLFIDFVFMTFFQYHNQVLYPSSSRSYPLVRKFFLPSTMRNSSLLVLPVVPVYRWCSRGTGRFRVEITKIFFFFVRLQTSSRYTILYYIQTNKVINLVGVIYC